MVRTGMGEVVDGSVEAVDWGKGKAYYKWSGKRDSELDRAYSHSSRRRAARTEWKG